MCNGAGTMNSYEQFSVCVPVARTLRDSYGQLFILFIRPHFRQDFRPDSTHPLRDLPADGGRDCLAWAGSRRLDVTGRSKPRLTGCAPLTSGMLRCRFFRGPCVAGNAGPDTGPATDIFRAFRFASGKPK